MEKADLLTFSPEAWRRLIEDIWWAGME